MGWKPTIHATARTSPAAVRLSSSYAVSATRWVGWPVTPIGHRRATGLTRHTQSRVGADLTDLRCACRASGGGAPPAQGSVMRTMDKRVVGTLLVATVGLTSATVVAGPAEAAPPARIKGIVSRRCER